MDEEECKLGQGGWSKKLLPTDILAIGYLRDDLRLKMSYSILNSLIIHLKVFEESEDTSDSSEDVLR